MLASFGRWPRRSSSPHFRANTPCRRFLPTTETRFVWTLAIRQTAGGAESTVWPTGVTIAIAAIKSVETTSSARVQLRGILLQSADIIVEIMGATLPIKDLPSRKWTAIRRKAEQMGTTPERYLRALIDEDLALDHKAQTVPLSELGRPFEKALEGVSDSELDAIVDRARARHRRARDTHSVQ